MAEGGHLEVVVVTGLSGAGKSTAVNALEDKVKSLMESATQFGKPKRTEQVKVKEMAMAEEIKTKAKKNMQTKKKQKNNKKKQTNKKNKKKKTKDNKHAKQKQK